MWAVYKLKPGKILLGKMKESKGSSANPLPSLSLSTQPNRISQVAYSSSQRLNGRTSTNLSEYFPPVGDSQLAQTESLLNDLDAMDSAKVPPTAQRYTTTTTTDSKTRYAMQTMSPGAVSTPGLMAAEQIHVDCMQITRDGKHVVTGSMNSPPLIWDLKTGALVRSLQGEEVSSTDLHLAAGDSLIVGQVAEYTSLDPVDGTMSSNLLSRKFQVIIDR